jgi:acetylornithine/LysW-gamma-L-lysine aminotransferase
MIEHSELPSSNPATLMDLESTYTSGVYPKRPLAIVRGKGARVWDAAGREYIDCVAGQGAANLGHAHPAIVTAIADQAARLISCPEIFYNDRRAEFLAALAGVAPAGLERAFLCNSGTEAVEAAIKFARLSTGRPEVIAAMRGFHGRTLGALSATWNRDYRRPFEPLLPGFSHVPFGDLPTLEQAITDRTAAVLLEAVQGEGGVHPAEPGYLSGVQQLCREKAVLLILDEVQTGYGRTGRFWACQHYGVQPDLMAIAKSMAGGLPMGACLIGSRIGTLPKLAHGSTFGGNPLACAAALATLDVMEREKLPARSAQLGEYLLGRLRSLDFPLIRQVRGMGLMIGIELRSTVTPILRQLQELGILALPAGSTVLRLLPPLVIERTDLDRVVEAIAETLSREIGGTSPRETSETSQDVPNRGRD